VTGEMWAAIVGSGVLVLGGLIGWVISWLRSEASEAVQAAATAQEHSHKVERDFLAYQAKAAENLRVVEVTYLEYKLYVSNEYVRRGDQSAVLSEIFRKIEGLTTLVGDMGEKMQERFDARMKAIENRIDGKEDKQSRRNNTDQG
jgi:translation elongation factor EF-Ts